MNSGHVHYKKPRPGNDTSSEWLDYVSPTVGLHSGLPVDLLRINALGVDVGDGYGITFLRGERRHYWNN